MKQRHGIVGSATGILPARPHRGRFEQWPYIGAAPPRLIYRSRPPPLRLTFVSPASVACWRTHRCAGLACNHCEPSGRQFVMAIILGACLLSFAVTHLLYSSPWEEN